MKELLLEMVVCPVCLPNEIGLAADIIERERGGDNRRRPGLPPVRRQLPDPGED
jgi:hypothetical protein